MCTIRPEVILSPMCQKLSFPFLSFPTVLHERRKLEIADSFCKDYYLVPFYITLTEGGTETFSGEKFLELVLVSVSTPAFLFKA